MVPGARLATAALRARPADHADRYGIAGQRTAIARALIRRPRILILDDALSSVDTYTEEKILGHLRRITRDRTSLIVSHRVSTVKDADMIVVLEDGRIAERGTHDSLIARGGLYAALYEKQLLEEELAAS